MVAVAHLISPASLPRPPPSPEQLSVLSYNVLLPNSVDGWWTYKMYNPPLSSELQYIASWEYRLNLLRDRIGMIDADVVCLQEVSPTSFEQDFSFMEELGYDGMELFRRGRFRPATFWRTARCDLVVPPVHKDRTLLTSFQLMATCEDDKQKRAWHVMNCHLQAGKEGARRVRQINEGVRAAFNLAKKLKEEDPAAVRLIVCGDFNGGPDCGAVRYIEDGFVDTDFREDGEPVTSKRKASPLSKPLMDVTTVEGLARGRPPPPTLVVPELISLMVEEGTMDNPRLSKTVLERLERIYERFASHTNGSRKLMNVADVERWLIAVNGQVGRGNEFRLAAKEMGWKEPPPPEDAEADVQQAAEDPKPKITLPPNGLLKLDGFIRVYEDELRRGMFWEIAYGLAVLKEPLPDAGVFAARYDRMYCSASLRPTAVLDTLSDKACPNESEPSDHLPVAATFQLS